MPKISFRKLWMDGLDWVTALKEALSNDWRQFWNQLTDLDNAVPRMLMWSIHWCADTYIGSGWCVRRSLHSLHLHSISQWKRSDDGVLSLCPNMSGSQCQYNSPRLSYGAQPYCQDCWINYEIWSCLHSMTYLWMDSMTVASLTEGKIVILEEFLANRVAEI